MLKSTLETIKVDFTSDSARDFYQGAAVWLRGFGRGLYAPFFMSSASRENKRDSTERYPSDEYRQLDIRLESVNHGLALGVCVSVPTGVIASATTGHFGKYIAAIVVGNVIDYLYSTYTRSREQQTSHQNP